MTGRGEVHICFLHYSSTFVSKGMLWFHSHHKFIVLNFWPSQDENLSNIHHKKTEFTQWCKAAFFLKSYKKEFLCLFFFYRLLTASRLLCFYSLTSTNAKTVLFYLYQAFTITSFELILSNKTLLLCQFTHRAHSESLIAQFAPLLNEYYLFLRMTPWIPSILKPLVQSHIEKTRPTYSI